MKQLTKNNFVIVAPPRSGTGYIAQVLNNLGVRTGHEDWFGPKGFVYDKRLFGDSSWLAIPYLPQLTQKTRVYFQTRDPRKAIESLHQVSFFNRNTSFRSFAFKHANIEASEPHFYKCVDFYLDWYAKLLEFRLPDYHVETITSDDIRRIIGPLKAVSDKLIIEAMAKTGTAVNSRSKEKKLPKPDWSELDQSRLDKLVEIEAKLGYKTSR